jgi:hypothetical protein
MDAGYGMQDTGDWTPGLETRDWTSNGSAVGGHLALTLTVGLFWAEVSAPPLGCWSLLESGCVSSSHSFNHSAWIL